MSPWEGAEYVLPGDEKAITPATPAQGEAKGAPTPASADQVKKADDAQAKAPPATPKTTETPAQTGAGEGANKAAAKQAAETPAKPKAAAKPKAPAKPKTPAKPKGGDA
jgi:NADH-quinone oxidoreductase subunit C